MSSIEGEPSYSNREHHESASWSDQSRWPAIPVPSEVRASAPPGRQGCRRREDVSTSAQLPEALSARVLRRRLIHRFDRVLGNDQN
jgi:hypothetical protein